MHFRCTARARPSRSGPDETKERSLHRGGGGDGGGYVGFTGGFRLLWPQERQLVFTVVRKFSSSARCSTLLSSQKLSDNLPAMLFYPCSPRLYHVSRHATEIIGEMPYAKPIPPSQLKNDRFLARLESARLGLAWLEIALRWNAI